MQTILRHCLLWLVIILIGSCGPADRPPLTTPTLPGKRSVAPPAIAALHAFTSDTTQTRLLLRADSTFVLETASAGQTAPVTMSGRLAITATHYHLFFPDTMAHFNELITSVHPDGSVVAYPDYSVALDKKLRQLYVNSVLVTANSVAHP